MFQNINENTIDLEQEPKRKIRDMAIFTNLFTKDNIALYIVSFMLSFVGIGTEFSVFSISMLGACFASSVPLLGIMIVSVIGNAVKFGIGGALEYFITALVMVVSLFIIKARYNEQERNEKIKVGKNVLIATLLVQIIKLAMSTFTMYDVLSGITIALIAYVFYKIFVNSIIVLQDFTSKRAFSIEEVIGTSLLLAISVGCFGGLNIYGFGITNILSILIVMILGWQNGMLVGATSGITIGITLGIITGTEPIMVAAYAISGLVAGLLNRFGKIGVAVGFALGNIILAYVSNGYTVELIHFKEILIASIGLFAVPKTLHLDIEEFLGKSKLLPNVPNRALNKSKQMIENLNNVSEAIQEMATTYKSTEPHTFDANSKKNTNKQIFLTELLGELEPYKDNMLYEDITAVDSKIVDDIFNTLLDKQEIDRETLLQIFANCNSYIVDVEDKDVSNSLNTDIAQMIRSINTAYKISKANFVWQKKVEQNQKTMQSQLNGVSKAIKDMADGIKQEIEVEEKYETQKLQIVELLKAKQIEPQDISITKQKRFIIEIYVGEILETAKIDAIAKILTEVLEEEIVYNEEASVGNRLNFLSKDKFIMAIGSMQTTKAKSELSGDSILNIRLKDGKYLIAISDGMGSGREAKNSSTKAVKMLENMLLSGFDKEISIDLINSTLMNKNEELFATLDIAIVDLYEGNIEFIKSGACPTYLKNKKKIQMIKSNSLPTGIVNEMSIQSFDADIESGEIMLMCTDGILDSNVEYKNKELWIKYMLEDIETNNTQKIADIILNEAIDNNYGVAKDDMSVVVCKFVRA